MSERYEQRIAELYPRGRFLTVVQIERLIRAAYKEANADGKIGIDREDDTVSCLVTHIDDIV